MQLHGELKVPELTSHSDRMLVNIFYLAPQEPSDISIQKALIFYNSLKEKVKALLLLCAMVKFHFMKNRVLVHVQYETQTSCLLRRGFITGLMLAIVKF